MHASARRLASYIRFQRPAASIRIVGRFCQTGARHDDQDHPDLRPDASLPDRLRSVAQRRPVDSHTARDSLDWAGSYEGVLPCADCPGIRTRVTLSDNGRYEKQTQYLDRQPQPEVVAGTFSGNPTAAPSAWTPPATASATSSAKTS